ncbi:rRNA maturation RNase YbeY [bacterium]|nr:rRNA maturation RNase YbeY [bacterium]
MIDLLVNDALEIPDYSEELTRVAQDTLLLVQPGLKCDISIALTTDEDIRQLNAQFRGIDRPTDVLSFESDETDPETGVRYLGDIVISYPRALQQAREAGHPVNNELMLLTTHGVLHLLGYDHGTPESKKAMWSLQDQVLQTNHVHLNKISGDDENE